MADEITVPVLPCRSIDEIDAFYTMLGFTRTYYQTRPNPFIALQREDLRLQFVGMPDFVPEDSYGTCVVLVPDTAALFEAFAAAMRAAHGKILVSGIPRMTRPRLRKNAEGRTGFSVIDPGGNWIRIMAATTGPGDDDVASGRLTGTLRSAVVMGDSHGLHVRAAEILDAGLLRHRAAATTAEVVEALAYRAELALRADDTAAAAAAVAEARALPLTEGERDSVADALAGLDDAEATLRGRPPADPAT